MAKQNKEVKNDTSDRAKEEKKQLHDEIKNEENTPRSPMQDRGTEQ